MPKVKHLGGQDWEGLEKVQEGTPGDDYKTIHRNSAWRCGGQPGEPCFCQQRHPLWLTQGPDGEPAGAWGVSASDHQGRVMPVSRGKC